MSQADHIVPAMPALALLADNGGIVTVNPNWCDWYEQVFNQPAGAGYIKGREVMQQIDGAFSEFFTQRSEAVKSAIHSMMEQDPNCPSERFSTIAGAKKSMSTDGKFAMDFNNEEEVFTFDGYFSVKDMEAILFIHRAEALIEKAKKKFGPFIETAAANGGLEHVDVNQLMQVLRPSVEVTDIDSTIFATPVTSASISGEYAEGLSKLYDAALEHPSSAKALHRSTGDDFEKKLHAEIVGGGLRRGESMAISVETDRSKTLLVGGLPMHAFEKGDPDQEMLETLLDRVNNFSKHFPDTPLSVESIQGNFKALEDFGSMFFTKGDHGAIYLCRYNGLVKENLISFKAMEYSNPEGQIVVIEHNATVLSYDEAKAFIYMFIDLTPARVKATDQGSKILADNMFESMSVERLDVTGKPMPKFFVTDMAGGNAVEKDLSVLREMETSDFSESLDWITKGYPLSERDDERFVGFTLSDFAKVAAERINRLQNEIHG